MRRWLVIFLMVLMPMKLSWAAVVVYCQHETGAAAQHMGHHDADHAQAPSPSSAQAAPDLTSTEDMGCDCSTCHMGCAALALPSDVALGNWQTGRVLAIALPRPEASAPLPRPERPKWAILT